ncbi:MAG: LysM peptidoglycan-binding domain-containing protein [Halobacteriovoraceae bacterium]|jgi:hypothetical protein|nr:LysM peptidoglycan-binding domain-containing protein [Halobacteriovoraceae bacterium]MBT5095243.1 LysM peptidoglycan-binding domain-containing protein [Halobacteriovoraceae bacterium]
MRIFIFLLLFSQALQAIEPEGSFYHEVKSGETTLSQLALVYYGDEKFSQKIAGWNNLEEPYRLSVGQKIRLSDPVYLYPINKQRGEGSAYRQWLERSELGESIRYRVNQNDKSYYQVKFSKVEGEIANYQKKKEIAIHQLWQSEDWKKDFTKAEDLYFKKKYHEALLYLDKALSVEASYAPIYFYQLKIYQLTGNKKGWQRAKKSLSWRFPSISKLSSFENY